MSTEELGTLNDGEPAVVVPAEEGTAEPETPAVDPPVGEDVGEDEEDHPKRKSGSQRAREKAMRLEIENEILKAQLAGKKPEPEAPQAVGEPTPDAFENYSDYVKALAKYTYHQEKEQSEAQARNAEVSQSWEAKKTEARKEIKDFDDVVNYMDTPSPAALAVMAESDHTAKIAYYLGTHPDELSRLNTLPPAKAALEVARIEARFTAPPKPTRTSTAAPPPPTPVGGKGIPVVDESKLSDAEWAARRLQKRLG